MQRQVRRAGSITHPVFARASIVIIALGCAVDVLSGGRAGAMSWLSFWVSTVGVAFGAWCAMFAVLDWVLYADLGERGISGLDGFASGMVVGLCGIALLLRVDCNAHAAVAGATSLEWVAIALMCVKSWIGRELASGIAQRR